MTPSEAQSWLAPVAVRTGSLAVGGINVTLPDMVQSAISVVATLAQQVGQLTGDELRWGAERGSGLTGRLTLRRDAPFVVAKSGTIETITGLTGVYSGQASYTGAADMPGVVVPSGLRLDGPLWAAEGYRPTNVSHAATGASWRPQGGSVLVACEWADAWGLEVVARGQVYDVAHSGRWVGRIRVTDVTREHRGRPDGAGSIVLRLSGQGVA
jgi:hypothetical protein